MRVGRERGEHLQTIVARTWLGIPFVASPGIF